MERKFVNGSQTTELTEVESLMVSNLIHGFREANSPHMFIYMFHGALKELVDWGKEE